jgi:hypothetical protein
MNTLLAPLLLFSFLASTVFAQTAPTPATPINVDLCETTLISWTATTPPYILSLHSEPASNNDLVENLVQQNTTTYSWLVNIQNAPMGYYLIVKDGVGNQGLSGPFTINSGVSTSCLNSTSTVSGATSTGAAGGTNPTSVGGTTGSTGSTSPTSGSVTPSSVPKASSSTTSGATSSPSTGAAAAHSAPFGILAMTGAAALAFALAL